MTSTCNLVSGWGLGTEKDKNKNEENLNIVFSYYKCIIIGSLMLKNITLM